ncbi:MAG TPA: cell division protein FtsA [Bacilli bacterium]|nr:cell division protein FtsA [Bacilli bacterium]
MRKIYTSIDLGSDSIKILVGEIYNKKLNVLSATSVKSNGIKNGLIVDANDTLLSIKEAIKEIEEKLLISIKKVIASVPSYYSSYEIVNGEIELDSIENKINGYDIVKVLQKAAKDKLSKDRELVSIIPIHFTVDNKKNIKDPKNLVGKKLSVKAMMITTPSKNVQSIISIFQTLGIEVIDINLGSIADYMEFKDNNTDNDITAIINIGYDTTTVSLFNKGIIVNSEVLQIGGKSIDNDISYVFKIDKEESKKLKETFAVAHKKLSKVNEVYETNNINNDLINITQYDISQVVMSRLVEILKLAKKQTYLLTNREISYIIITGGTSEMPGITYLIDDIFGNNTKLGKIETIGIRSNKYSIVSGLIKSFDTKLNFRNKEYSMIGISEAEELTNQRKRLNINDNSVVGKVFGYFFDD